MLWTIFARLFGDAGRKTRRGLSRLGAGLLALGLAAPAAFAFDTEARNVYIMDYESGTMLFEKDGETPVPTASMSKMMTAYVVFQQLKSGKLRLDDELPVSEKAWRNSFSGSTMYVPYHGADVQKVKVEDLIRGMLVASGNDACIVLAEGIAGSEEEFVRMMNDEAAKLGLRQSHFLNVTGLPPDNPTGVLATDHLMSAHDLALLGAHLIRDFPEYYHYFSEMDFTYGVDKKSGKPIKQGNRNPLLYGSAGADGIKTGHTNDAGFSLTGSVKRGDRRIIVVATGLKSKKGRSEEAERIVDFAFREFDNYRIVKRGEELDQAPVFLGRQDKVPLVAGQDLTLAMARTARNEMKVTISYDAPLKAPVAAGVAVGTLTVTAPDMAPRTVPLLTGASVTELGPIGRIGAAVDYLIWHGKS